MPGDGDQGFGDYTFDVDAFELRHRGDVVAMEPQVLEVLSYFLEHPHQLVRKEDLLDNVWGDRFVSESALTSRIRSVRKALGDDGKSQKAIQTVHGRGYRYIGDVEIRRAAAGENRRLSASGPGPTETPHNLPSPRTRFVGRGEEVANVSALVQTNRLVSLLGMGGSGKTRLAIEVARASLAAFPDGVWFVDLVPRRSADPLDVAVADAAGISLSSGVDAASLPDVVGERRLLLVLDNCEHLIGPVSELVDALLDSTACHFLLTSRLPLNLAGEYRCRVGSMLLEGNDADAVELFLATAGRFGADVTTLDRDLVGQVCRRLDGLALALELAAAQLRHLPLAEVVARLDTRFDLLVSGTRDARHPSLAAVLDDSWDGLTADEKSLLSALSAFPGDFALRDVEEMLDRGDVVPVLGGLIDRSLVTVRSGSDARYHLLDSVRAFGRSRGGEQSASEALERHAQWCAERVGRDVGRHLFDYWNARWCQDHYDDLRAAEAHFTETGRVAEGAMLNCGASFAWHLDLGALAADALRRIDTQLAVVDDRTLATRLHMAAVFAGMASRSPGRIAEHGRSALGAARDLGDPELLCPALVLASWSEVFEDGDAALSMVSEAAHLADAAGDFSGWAFAESYRSWHLAVLRRPNEAVEVAASVVERVGDDVNYPAASARNSLAALLVLDEPSTAASVLFDHPAHPTNRDMWAQDVLAACVTASNGDAGDARRMVLGIHDYLRQAGIDGFPDLLVPCAVLALEQGDEKTAQRWTDAVRRWARPTQSFQVTTIYRQLRQRLGPTADGVSRAASVEDHGGAALEWLSELSL